MRLLSHLTIAYSRLAALVVASCPLAAIAAPVTYSDVLELPFSSTMREHSYGHTPLNTVVNIHEGGTSRGVAVLVHGGCWSNAYDRHHALPMAEALSEAGYDVWIPEYRRVGDAGGGWPGSLEDIVTVATFVTGKTGRRPILIGHSAGGHLALRAAQTGLEVEGVVGLAPITDLVAYGAQSGSCQSMVAPFMGDEAYSPNENYQDASVTLSDISVPISIVIGAEDPIVGQDQVASFSTEQLTFVEGAGHFDVIHPETEAFTAVLRALETLQKAGSVTP